MSSNKSEIVYTGRLGSILVQMDKGLIKFINRQPKHVCDADFKRLCRHPDFVSGDDFRKTMEERTSPGPLILKRAHAMGDLIMLRAAAAAFQRIRPGYILSLACDRRYADIFQADTLWNRKLPQGTPVFNLDQVAEQDHRGTERHRLELFWSAMTTRQLDIKPEDWAIPIPAETSEWVNHWCAKSGLSGRPLVALQLRGSGLMKSMPMEQMKKLAGALAEHADVVLIEYDVTKCWKANGVFSMAGRDALHSIEVLKRCELCVCFDSGVLWMAHAATCPVLCIMGPTRPAQRLVYHPLYDQGKVQAVQLNDLIVLDGRSGKPGCEPCFERAERCKGSYACMQRQPDSVVSVIADKALAMLGMKLSLPVVEGVRV